MSSISKAIGAATGGVVAGAGAGYLMLPEGSPWYAYPIMALVIGLIPAVTTYLAPRNTP